MTQKYTTQSFSRIVLWTKSVMKVISFIKIFSAIASSCCQEKPSTFGFWFVSCSILSTSSHLIEPEKISTQLNAGRASEHTQKRNFDGFCLHKSLSHYPPPPKKKNYGASLTVLLLFEIPQKFSKETWLAC